MPSLININPEIEPRTVIPLGRALLMIGSSPQGADITLEGSEISPNHASIVRYGEHYNLRDNGSVSGSYVNAKQVSFHQLEHLDILRFGEYQFLVDLRDEITPIATQTHKDYVKGELPKITIPKSHNPADYKEFYDLQIENVVSHEQEPTGEEVTAEKPKPYPPKRVAPPIRIVTRE